MTAIFAHSGCPGVPTPRENTIGAFVAAGQAGSDGGLAVNVEMKCSGRCSAAATTLAGGLPGDGTALVSSFHRGCLTALRRLAASVPAARAILGGMATGAEGSQQCSP